MKKYVAILTLGVLLSMGTVYAQETTGSIIGVVTSQDGATMPGVTVTIDDEETGFERYTVTNAAGEYKFVALQPSKYGLTATLDGFQTYQRNLDVALGRTVKNDFVMTLGAVTDVIEVTGEAPLVDVTSTTSGMTVNTDDLNANVPIGREVTQIALMAPAVVGSDSSFNSDSSYTPGQNVASIGGASPGENVYAVNGLNVTNFRNFVGSTFVPFEFLEEAQIKTGGYEAEFSRATGGVINMVTKSGTNSFHGGASLYYEPESLQEQSPDAWNRDNQEEFSKEFEAQLSIGGPIVKDHLFFFAFGRYIDSEYSNEVGNLDTHSAEGRYTVTKNAVPYYGGKVDWNITNNHRIEGTYLDDSTDLESDRYTYDPVTRTQGDYIGTGVNSRGGTNYILKYTGIFSDNFLASGQYGVNEFGRTDGSNADDCYYAFDSRVSTTPIGCWVNWQIANGDDTRTAYRIDADWYLGNHSIRGGFDNEDLESTENAIYSGGTRYIYLANADYPEIPAGADVVEVRNRLTGGTFESTNTGIYAQDSWAITPNLTFNFGIRWEQFESFNSAGDAFIKIDNQYAPRLGLIWDPSGNGRSKLYGSFGQYHIPIATNTNIRLAGLEFDEFEYYEVTGQNGGLPYNPDGSPTGLGQLLEVIPVSNGEIPDTSTIVASSFDPMSQMEYILGYEHMVGQDWSFGIRGVHRNFVAVIEDFTIDEGLADKYGLEENYFNYVLGNPGSSYEGFYDLDGDGTPDPISFTAAELGYPDAQRDYWAVELTANRRFSNNWLMQANYTWSQSYGNYEGYLKSDLGQDDAGLTQDFDFAGLMDNAYGFLPNDRRHNLKVYGSYSFNFGLQLGAFAYYRTGRPMNALGKHPTDDFATLYGVGSFFEQTAPGAANSVASARGSQGTTETTWGLDALIKYDFVLGGMNLFARLDIFNLFDLSAQAQVREQSGTTTFGVDEGWLQTTVYQAPRTLRFGIGLSF